MTTEDELQAALDANPGERSFYLGLLVDYLTERDDPRAEGYRVMIEGEYAAKNLLSLEPTRRPLTFSSGDRQPGETGGS